MERRRKQSEKDGTLKRKIESKPEMKARTKTKSPDHADSWLIGLELCRERLGFVAVGMENKRALVNQDRKAKLRLVNRMYANATHQFGYRDQEVAA